MQCWPQARALEPGMASWQWSDPGAFDPTHPTFFLNILDIYGSLSSTTCPSVLSNNSD